MNDSTERTVLERGDDGLVLRHGPLELTYSDERGTLERIRHGALDLAVQSDDGDPPTTWLVGGQEQRHPPSDKTSYPDAERIGGERTLESVDLVRTGRRSRLRITSTCSKWELVEEYTFEQGSTRVRYEPTLVYRGDDGAKLRRIEHAVPFADLDDGAWTIDVPGAPVPPARSLDSFDPGPILRWGERRIHLGLVGLENTTSESSIGVWAFSRHHPVSLELARTSGGATIRYTLETASVLDSGEGIAFESVWFEPFTSRWTAALDRFGQWWDEIGFSAPDDVPDWAQNATYYEVFVGQTVMDGTGYDPYSTVNDLIDDLPRIAALGFDVIQLMPRQPYPSYQFTDYPAGDDPWGQSEEIRALRDAAHSQDMRLILDVVLHGVLDRTVLDRTVESIQENDLRDGDDASIAEYVLDHAPEWRPRLPETHPLVEDHPEWFIRDDDGEIAHRYTHAFDLGNRKFQDYVVETLTSLVTDLGVDGFRIDAPTWNNLPNWDESLPYPANYSRLGAVELLARARRAVRSIQPDVLLYVEAAGPLFRESSDANYNYDEIWLAEAIYGAHTSAYGQPVQEPVTGTDLEAWLARRKCVLPPGTAERTVHHVDSHDTYWWSSPGEKWFTERYGEPQTVAMLAVFSLIDGGFMTFAGAEAGLEEELETMLTLRAQLPELAEGECSYDAVDCDATSVFSAVRTLDGKCSIIAVNLSESSQEATVTVPEELIASSDRLVTFDALRDESVATDDNRLKDGNIHLELDFEPYEPRLIVFRDVGS